MTVRARLPGPLLAFGAVNSVGPRDVVISVDESEGLGGLPGLLVVESGRAVPLPVSACR